MTRYLSGFALTAGLMLGACADEQPTAPDDSSSEQLSVAQAPAYFTLNEFEGSFDAETGEFRLEMIEADELVAEDFRTNRQNYGFCNDFSVNIAGADIGANTVADSIFYTVDDCIPADEVLAWSGLFYTAGGAFCATIRVDNRMTFTLENVIAEITEITTGYEGYTYQDGAVPSCCGTGADLSGLAGQNLPTDLTGGAFLHAATLATGEAADQQWTFQNAGGSFSFRGRVVSQVLEGDNGLDDDCDGIVDNALGEFADGAGCREDIDCDSGACEGIDPLSGFGSCAAGCPPDTFGPTCDPCTVDCNGNGACDDGLSGTGLCVCDAGWAGAACDDCAPTNFGADCSGVCSACGAFGACSSGVAGDGSCVCMPGGYGPSCEFSCTNGITDGDEEGVDCGGATCGACPDLGTDCNERGVPGAGIGLVPIVHEVGDDCDPIEDGICLQRTSSGIFYNEAAGETTYNTSVSPLNTVWTLGSCADALAGTPAWNTMRNTVAGLMRSAAGMELCMVSTDSLNFYDIIIDAWGQRAGTWSYQRTGVACLCDAGFHGAECEFSCSDGLLNGQEEAIDCGGPGCAACPDPAVDPTVLCNFQGTFSETSTDVTYLADSPCYYISDGVCIARSSSGGPPYNEATGHAGGHDHTHLEGSLWAAGACGTVTPSNNAPFIHTGNSSLWMFGEWCMLDESTGIEHSITVSGWDTSRGGGWVFNHTGGSCACDAGAHGGSCQYSCSDGVQNGDEDQVDCGGDTCAPCLDNWECGFNGVAGGSADFVWDGATCDPISAGVCLARGTSQGLYNAVSESAWNGTGPLSTLWGNGSCADTAPTQGWRDAVYADGDGPRYSVGETYCMLDTTTGLKHEITTTSWVSSGGGGGFSYTRVQECACDPGFHGPFCEETCSDGIENGDEDLVDCGGDLCAPCPENWECNFNGIAAPGTQTVELGGGACDPISDNVCLQRSTSNGGPVYNELSGSSGGHDHGGLAGTAWEMGTCDTVDPTNADPFLHMGNNSGWMIGDWCMVDTATGVEYDISILAWGTSRAGTMTYTRDGIACTCDPGLHGNACEFSCTDGIQNGDEELADCGGDTCTPCADNWQCNFSGVYSEVSTDVTYLADAACYYISDGVCLARTTGGPIYNAASGSTGGHDHSGLADTAWFFGACGTTTPTDSDPFLHMGNSSGWMLGEWCMLDMTTGLEHSITFTGWDSGGVGGLTYTHVGDDCACDPGFHGNFCEFTCTDGIQNGDEDLVDCGGDTCGPCADNWECNFNGVFAEVSTDVTYLADSPCHYISDGVCIARSSAGGPPYNEATGHVGGHDHTHLEGSLWALGACGSVTPSSNAPWSHTGNSSLWMLGEWCMLDESTGLEHSITVSGWDSGRSGGWVFNHTGGACTCDPGGHGGACEFSCTDGVQNGDEDHIDCGGDTCAPCPVNWECNYNGTFTGTTVDYVQDGGDGSCDAVSAGVCISRGTSQGLYNTITDSAWDWGDLGPEGTTWDGLFPCGFLTAPGSLWRDAVWALGSGPRDIVGKDFCMLDSTTDEEWTILFTDWQQSGAGGDFAYTRSQHSCDCDPGFSGDYCEIAP